MSLRQELNWDDDPDADVPSDPEDSSSAQETDDAANAIDSLADVARRIKDGSIKNVVIMAGAGISTSAGIPDFRSPDTGLYANLQRFKLPYPEAIFTLSYFKKKPEPFYVLAQDLYPADAIALFFRLLHDKGLLARVYTQNIDTLETIAGLPADKVVEAHGSFAKSRCLTCRAETSDAHMLAGARKGQVVRCERNGCNGLVKPDIVFFGEGLPDRFFERTPGDMRKCDLLIVLGTSLQVQPFASLITRVSGGCPRLLFNRELVGDKQYGGFEFHEGSSDYFYEGDTDTGCRELATELGWDQELDDLIMGHQAELRGVWGIEAKSPSKTEAAKKAAAAAKKVAQSGDVDEIAASLEAAEIADKRAKVTGTDHGKGGSQLRERL